MHSSRGLHPEEEHLHHRQKILPDPEQTGRAGGDRPGVGPGQQGGHVPGVPGRVLAAGAAAPLPRLWQGVVQQLRRQQGPRQVQELRGSAGVFAVLRGAAEEIPSPAPGAHTQVQGETRIREQVCIPQNQCTQVRHSRGRLRHGADVRLPQDEAAREVAGGLVGAAGPRPLQIRGHEGSQGSGGHSRPRLDARVTR